MRIAILAAASTAAALTLGLFDPTPAEAKSRHVAVRKAPARAVVRQSVKPQTLRHAKKHYTPKLKVEKKIIT